MEWTSTVHQCTPLWGRRMLVRVLQVYDLYGWNPFVYTDLIQTICYTEIPTAYTLCCSVQNAEIYGKFEWSIEYCMGQEVHDLAHEMLLKSFNDSPAQCKTDLLSQKRARSETAVSGKRGFGWFVVGFVDFCCTLTLTLCTCHFGAANDILAYAYLQLAIQSEQKALVLSPSSRLIIKKYGSSNMCAPAKQLTSMEQPWSKLLLWCYQV